MPKSGIAWKLFALVIALFTLSGLSQAQSLATFDATVGGGAGPASTQNLIRNFDTIVLPNVVADSASGWNSTTNQYTIPATGLYLITSRLRLVDDTTTAGFAQGVNTLNGDGPWMVWNQFTGKRTTIINARTALFTQGQVVDLFGYCDSYSACNIDSAELTIQQQCTIALCASSGGGTSPTSNGITVWNGAWATSLAPPSSALVGLSDTQSLTNKTLDGVSPTTMGFVDVTSSAQNQLNARLTIANNLSDLNNAATARTNLGLGTAATTAASAYDVSGAASTAQTAAIASAVSTGLQKASNLSDLANAATARTNLGLGTAATTAASAYDVSGAAATAQTNAETFSANASNLASGTILASLLPLGSASVFGALKCGSGTSCTAGVLTVTGGAGGTVTNTAGSLTADFMMIGNGGADSKVDTGCSSDGAGTLTCLAYKTSSSSVNGSFTSTYKGTAATTPSAHQFQLSTVVDVTTPWVLSPAAAPSTGLLFGTNTSSTVQQSFVAPTSGGVLYGSSSTAVAFSAALAANTLVMGGGAGAAPTTGAGDFTYITHTLAGDATAILDMHLGSFLLPGSLATGGVKVTTTTGVVSSYSLNRSLGWSFGDAATGSALTTSEVGYITVPFACTVTGWHIMVDSGTATIKVARVNGGTALPTVGSNSISTSGVSLSTGTKVDSTTLTDFTSTAIAANDTLGYFVTAVSGAKQITFSLDCAQ